MHNIIKLSLSLNITRPNQLSTPSTPSATPSSYHYDANGDLVLPEKILVSNRDDCFGFKLAKPLKDWEHKLEQLTYPLVAEQKLDGIRCQIILALNRTRRSIRAWAYTRNGNRLHSIDHIVSEMESLFNWSSAIDNIFHRDYDYLSLDGELQLRVPNAPFRIVNGLANRSATDDESRQLHFHIYNMYYLSQRLSPLHQVDKTQYYNYLAYLGYENATTFRRIDESYFVYGVDALKSLIAEHQACGSEGLIIKDPYESATNHRTTEWQKIKFKRRGTFRLAEIVEGDGKCFGTTGAIVVADSNGTRSRVGTGFTDAERNELYLLAGECHRRLILVEIEYLALTKGSLREAVYCGLRKDIEPSESAIDEFKDRGE